MRIEAWRRNLSTQEERRRPSARLVTAPRPRARRAPSRPPTGPARFADFSRNTNADLLYQRLHADIVSLSLTPGTPISESRVAAEAGVSRTPVREALLRLAKEKLVEIVPKSGTFVGRIPVSSLVEGLVSRRALEAVTVRAAVERATPGTVLEFRAMIERQREAAASGNLDSFHAADEVFHAGLARAADYDGIWELIRQVKIQVDRYRKLTLPQEGRVDLVVAEHEAVIDAMAEGDADGAVRAMESHLDKLQLDLQVFRDMWPTYFIRDREIGD